ncbi:dipeptidyl peptidase 2-like [Physella acuta]|uniref:dipeptidyl peptidase 2-like n=1 Tax=Physella acuta TaxID=109671 RepID=UPI0027DD3E8C|nr:dipeptidyl peptidase 2-like [Physella acuta]
MAATVKNCMLLFVIVVITLSLTTCHKFKDFPYKEAYYDQYVDHFNQMSFGEKTFKQHILYQDKYWDPKGGPIFFYAGNEGDIEGFWDASGFIHEIAPEFGAYVVFPEHRYYGKSLPFGNDSFKAGLLGLLTVEQAMADYAVFLTDLKQKLNATNSKIIAFGGSYGGMLAAYMRFKYPNIVDGSLAASAPLFMQDPAGPHDFFFQHVTQDFRDIDQKCYDLVKIAFQQMDILAAQGQPGLDQISTQFGLCKKLTDQDSYRHLQGWVRNAFTMMAMLDYPYPTGFMGNLPGFPVKVGCGAIMNESNPIVGLAKAAGVFYNSSSIPCYDIFEEFIECADPTGCGTGPAAIAWDYQACTELSLPRGSNNVTDMFPVLPWTPELRATYCQKTYGITPRESWASIQFLGLKIKSASNIIFSNGNLDPWMGGGINENLSPSLIAIPVSGGAHHLDLRASNQLDPIGVIVAREREKGIIRAWLSSP